MEQSPGAMWTCLLGAGLVLVLAPSVSITTHPRTPELVSCVFHERANITCQWKPGDPQMTHYTLRIKKMAGGEVFTCQSSDTNCTVTIGEATVRSDFCINITAHGRDGNVTSGPRCQSGRIEIMLKTVKLEDVRPVAADPQCLSVSWRRNWDFAVVPSEIKAGDLESQIAFKAEGQSDFQEKNVTVKDFTFPVCAFRADTTYTIKLRHRYKSSRSPWSLWSNTGQGRTAEDAPPSAPLFWRRVKETDKNGRRLTSLLWKPLPHFLANGIVRIYNVTCQTEAGLVLTDNGSCRNLHGSCTSCSLPLPPGRCSCSLTASNSVGTSPEAWIWLRGVQDADLPSVSQITAVPQDDHHLEVRWTAPAEPSPSGFVVEWFSVKEKSNSIIHWEHLNRSCTSLVISEGVEPLTRYTVSVIALYAEEGAGQNSTQLIYTRQGVPSAGPQVKVQKISGSTVELSWTPVPVEDLHGFICNYTIYYATTNQPARSEIVPGHVHRHTLLNLSPGHYNVFLRANTEAGPGENGTTVNVHIGSEEVPVVMYLIFLLVLTSGALVLMACLSHSNIVKHRLCQDIPDPSNSSLSHWTLKPALESMKWAPTPEKCEIKYSEVVLLNESELHNSESDQDFNIKTTCNLHMYSSHQYALHPGSESVDSHYKTTRCDMKYMRTPTGADTSSGADFSSCPSIYTNILYSQTLPLSLPLSYRDRHYGSVHVHDRELQPGGAGEQPGSPQTTSRGLSPPLSQTDGRGTHRHLHGTLSFSSLCGVSHPSPFLPHLVNAASQHLLTQNRFSSVQQLEPNTFNQPTNPPQNFTPFTQAVLLDFSHSPVDCDPYISV